MSTIPTALASAAPTSGNVAATGNDQSTNVGAGIIPNATTNGNGSQLSGFSFGQTLMQLVAVKLGSADVVEEPANGGSDGLPLANAIENLFSSVKGSSVSKLDSDLSKDEDQATDDLQKILDAISELLQNNSALDTAIAQDPALVIQLQSWIQQAMTLMQGTGDDQSQNKAEIGVNTSTSSLPALALYPQTLRFALQDTLQVLQEQLSGLDAEGKLNSSSFGQLVDSLQKTLQQTGHQPLVMQVMQPVMAEQSVQNGQNNNSTYLSKELEADPVITSVSSKDESLDDSQSNEQDASSSDNSNGKMNFSNIVTAGQLQLRDSAVAPVQLSNPVPVEKFTQEMSGFVVGKMDIVKLQGMSEATISLLPAHLGQVDVKISLHNGQVVAQFITEHAFAKDSLEQQMVQLRSALESQGLQVNKLEVTQNSSLSSHMYQDGKQPGAGSQQRQSDKRKATDDEEGLTSVETLEEWNDWVREIQSKQQSYGSSFVAKA